MKPNFSKMNYSDFCSWLMDTDEEYKKILEYEEWSVVRINQRYFFYDHVREGSSCDFFEVQPVAELHYSVNDDIQTDRPLDYLFDCVVCGEQIVNTEIIYWWFKKANTYER